MYFVYKHPEMQNDHSVNSRVKWREFKPVSKIISTSSIALRVYEMQYKLLKFIMAVGQLNTSIANNVLIIHEQS